MHTCIHTCMHTYMHTTQLVHTQLTRTYSSTHNLLHTNPSPSLFSFLLSPCYLYLSFAACWKKLTCGVIRSFIFFWFHTIAYPVPWNFHRIVYPKFVWGGGAGPLHWSVPYITCQILPHDPWKIHNIIRGVGGGILLVLHVIITLRRWWSFRVRANDGVWPCIYIYIHTYIIYLVVFLKKNKV